MKKQYESFRKFLTEAKDGKSDIFSIDCALVIGMSVKRTKGSILSDIRAIEGVTIVDMGEHRDSGGNNYSKITLKIDTSPLRQKSVSGNFLRIKKEVIRIPGVIRFEYLSSPVAI